VPSVAEVRVTPQPPRSQPSTDTGKSMVETAEGLAHRKQSDGLESDAVPKIAVPSALSEGEPETVYPSGKSMNSAPAAVHR
jgi:hypothetical protein